MSTVQTDGASPITAESTDNNGGVMKNASFIVSISEDIFQIDSNSSSIIKGTHNTKSIRTAKTSTAIREGNYNFYNGKFESGYPTESVYFLTSQNISVIFKQNSNFVSKTF